MIDRVPPHIHNLLIINGLVPFNKILTIFIWIPTFYNHIFVGVL